MSYQFYRTFLSDCERCGKLYYRITAVVGAAIEAVIKQGFEKKPAKELLAFVVIKGSSGLFVFD
ncbi:MAG: hypothetical protein OSA11_05640 [Candidatus Nanopelagicales bacterium]|nr:hypothetical protein [Candidatus Nanopelagicales bacterium]